ncbi:MAG: FecR family protein [Halieaceae bacterium]
MKIAIDKRILIVLLLALPGFAQANVGKVLFATGAVTVERTESIQVKRGDTLLQGDIIVTGSRARVQLLMLDGARISIRANSRLELETYRLDAAPSAVIAGGGAEGEVSLNLLKGGLRTITGAIGRVEHDDYSLQTPVATLGIRGTVYGAVHCDGDCPAKEPGTEPPADGTYAGVDIGGVNLKNKLGAVNLRRNQYGYVKDAFTPPEVLLAPPSVLSGGDEQGGEEEGGKEEGGKEEGADESGTDGAAEDSGALDGDELPLNKSDEPRDPNTGAPPPLEIFITDPDTGLRIRIDTGKPTDANGDPLPPVPVAVPEPVPEPEPEPTPEPEPEPTPEPEPEPTPEPEPEPTPEPEPEPTPEPEPEPTPEPEPEPTPEPEPEPQPYPYTDAETGDALEPPPSPPPPPTPAGPSREDIYLGLAYAVDETSYAEQDTADTLTVTANALTGFTAPLNSSDPPSNVIRTNGSTIVEGTTAIEHDLQWGRWGVSFTSGGVSNSLGTGEHLHYIREVGDRTNPTPVLPQSGSAEYRYHDGTTPSDNIPGVDSVDPISPFDITLSADFDEQLIDAYIEVTVNGNEWTGEGSAPLGSGPTFSGILDSVYVDGGDCECSSGHGAFQGFFTNFASDNPPGAVGMSWFMHGYIEDTPTTITGASALEFNMSLDEDY